LAGLTFVNQVGAVEGMNQAGPGTLIPDTFLRWAQDILVDRAGLIRRRGPFTNVTLYHKVTNSIFAFDPITELGAEYEVTLGMVSTYDPVGIPRIGMIVNSYKSNVATTILRVFSVDFTYLGSETIVATGYVPDLSIISCKPALGGGVWISFAADTSTGSSQYQFFWRGGYNATPVQSFPTGPAKFVSVTGASPTFNEVQSLNFDVGHNSFDTSVNLATGTTYISPGMFCFVTLSAATGVAAGDYYIGTIKNVNTSTNFTLDKFPFIWDPTVTNNHNILQTITKYDYSGPSSTTTITLNGATEIAVGDVISITATGNASVYDSNTSGLNYTVTAVNNSNPSSPTLTFAWSGAHTSVNTPTLINTVTLANSFKQLNVNALNLKFTTVRPYQHMHGRGVLSTTDPDLPDIISGDEGTSGDGRWASAKVTGYNVYRASDRAYLGKVKDTLSSGSPSNTLAHLYTDHGASLHGEEYIMYYPQPVNLANDFIISSRSPLNFGGLYTAVYAGYQWYGGLATSDKDHNRVVFSAYHDREAVDLSQDAADSIVFPGKSRFRGMAASQAGLLVFLDDRTYIVRGNDRTNFSVEQLIPEGCLSPGSIVEWGGGVFWAGRSGIMYYDGATVRNLTRDNLGLYYADSLNYFNPELNRVIGFMHKNNLVMHFTNWDSPYKPDRYEPIYATTWQDTAALKGRTGTSFRDAATFKSYSYSNEDLLTDGRNVPIYWERHTLNDAGSAGTDGKILVWGAFVTNKALSSTVATLTIGNHSYQVGDVVNVKNVDATFDGVQTITSATTTTISYAKYVTDVPSAVVSLPSMPITSSSLMPIVTTDLFSTWGGNGVNLYKWGPITNGTSMTFNIYMPTNALVTFSNLDFRGHTNIETVNGLKTLLGVNSVENSVLRARIIDMETVYDTHTNGQDPLLIEKINISNDKLVKGPDFFIQTKHFTEGDPVLRKWFQRIMISMLLYDGCLRMDVVDDDDNDSVDVNEKKHQYWETFTEVGYDWNYMTSTVFPKIASPNYNNWENIQGEYLIWDAVFTSEFNRYVKRLSWRKPSLGFKLYQLNKYLRPYTSIPIAPYRIEIHSFNIGFKSLRPGRV